MREVSIDKHVALFPRLEEEVQQTGELRVVRAGREVARARPARPSGMPCHASFGARTPIGRYRAGRRLVRIGMPDLRCYADTSAIPKGYLLGFGSEALDRYECALHLVHERPRAIDGVLGHAHPLGPRKGCDRLSTRPAPIVMRSSPAGPGIVFGALGAV